MGLVVTDLEADQTLQDLVLSVFRATTQAFDNTAALKIIENHLGVAFIQMAQTVVVQGPAGQRPFAELMPHDA